MPFFSLLLSCCCATPATRDDGVELLRSAEAPSGRAPAANESTSGGISQKHAAIPLLRKLDAKLKEKLLTGAILLLDADFLRSAKLERMLRRQDLEARASETGEAIFLAPAAAAALLEAGGRRIGSLTYGWGTPDHPDISGAVLAKLVAFLKSPLGAHVKGVFVDCAPPPRSPPHTALLRSRPDRRLAGGARKDLRPKFVSHPKRPK